MSTAFLFPGQGSQYVGMGKAWYRASEEARVFCEQADAYLGYALTALCFDGPDEKLNQTAFTQPAIFVISLAMWRAMRLPDPAFVAGHSLGEFAALVASGAIDFEPALSLVAARGRLMAKAGACVAGGMAVLLGATLDEAETLCAMASAATQSSLVVANDNCPGQVVISGDLRALDAAGAIAPDLGIRRVRRLAVSVAPHSPLMADLQAEFAALLAGVCIRVPQIPVILNATAMPVSDPVKIRRALLRQLTSPVRWRESMLWMAAQGVETFVEIGPKSVLSGLVKRTLEDARIVSLDKLSASEIAESLARCGVLNA